MGDSRLKAHLPISGQAGFFIRSERAEDKEIRGEAVDVPAVSLLVPTGIFNVSILELVCASQVPAAG